MPRTLFDKLWDAHTVGRTHAGETLLYIDRIALHERTGTIALNSLADRGLEPRHPEHIICVMDHIVDTRPDRTDATPVPNGEVFVTSTRGAARRFGLRLFDLDDPEQGISHLVSAEQGFALPGLTVVCPDSHTCTLGALGALSFGIGTSQAEHAMATGTLPLTRPETMRVTFTGEPAQGVYAKDLVLYFIAREGAGVANGRMVEFAGDAVGRMTLEERMTLCNMAVEFSAFSALVAPDDKTFDYVRGRRWAPDPLPIDCWRKLRDDPDAEFDPDLTLDVAGIEPQVTWGTSPEQVTSVRGRVPPDATGDGRALKYMGLKPGQRLSQVPIDAAYIGSCTNARLSDLRIAAAVLEGRRAAPGVRALCVPGSGRVKARAEAEGLDLVFKRAGFEWREPGCGLCFYAGGEHPGREARVVSTTNRNFEGRQGPGVRTHLASPSTVAASAVRGRFATPDMLE